jgi:hypothetical protein
VSVRPEPKPDQTFHVTSKQEFSISLDAGVTPGLPGAAQIITEMVLEYTQANGRFDDQGRMESQITIEQFDMKQSINGNAKPPSNAGQILGSSITAVFDRGGKLVDIKVPKELQQASSILKQLVAGANGPVNFLPASAMSVGDTETVPSTIPLQLAGSAASVPYQTRTVTTLRAIEKKGNDRVAHFEQRVESAAATDLLKVNGAGTIDVNLDRGYVSASATEWNFAGDNGMARGAASAPSGAVRGTIRVTVSAHE